MSLHRPILLVLLSILVARSEPAFPQSPASRSSAPRIATFDFLDVGQGDAILLRSPEGKSALIDAGTSGTRVVKLLEDLNVESLDLIVVSHHHMDHFGGMIEVVKRFSPKNYLDSNSSHGGSHYLNLLKELEGRRVRVLHSGSTSRRLDLGSIKMFILPQPPEDVKEENNNSVGLRVEFGEVSLLTTGDSESPERAWWLNNVPALCADATVLKLAHHGSRNGTDQRWLRAVRPSFGVVSVGNPNDYGHPHKETISYFSELGIPLRRTDQAGTISLQTDGKRWRLVRPRTPSRAKPERSKRDHVQALDPSGGLVHPNRASLEELLTLPGIGPSLAKRIREGRPYRSEEDLRRVEGIGEKRLDAIRPFIIID